MFKTVQAKMTDRSSLFATMNKSDNLEAKIVDLMQGRTINEETSLESFVLYKEGNNRLFKREIFALLQDGKIELKYNPMVALGMYLPFVPLINNNGQVKVVVNATSYCSEGEGGKIKIDVMDLIGLCQGAYAVYQSCIKYAKICSDFTMRKILIDTYVQILIKGLTGTSVFSSAQNLKYLTYICARFLLTAHFGLTGDSVHESAMTLAKLESDVEKSFISEMLLDTPKEDWYSLYGIVKILTSKFIALRGKVSVESLRQKVSIILGSPNTFAIDYIPYIVALGSGYYNNYSIYRSRLIKQELQPYCIAICENILQRL